MTKLFISYSHADEPLLKELTKHLSALRREGLITAWYDREILAGGNIDSEIDEQLDAADIAMMLVSADFLNSDYCSSIELKRALQRYRAGDLRVIPVILRDCDWRHSPLGKLNALPEDGCAVTSLADRDKAFADIARALRRVLSPPAQSTPEWGAAAMPSSSAPPGQRPSALLKRKLTDADRDAFVHSTFEHIANHFERELKALAASNHGVEANFRRIDANCFTAIVYRDGECIAQCSIRLEGIGNRPGGNILFSLNASVRTGSYNESLHLGQSDQDLFLETVGFSLSETKKEQLSAEDSAHVLWDLMLRNARR